MSSSKVFPGAAYGGEALFLVFFVMSPCCNVNDSLLVVFWCEQPRRNPSRIGTRIWQTVGDHNPCAKIGASTSVDDLSDLSVFGYAPWSSLANLPCQSCLVSVPTSPSVERTDNITHAV